jgi:hypothetical protein
VDAAEALQDLTEISSQIEAAVLLTSEGQTLASTLEDEEATNRLAQAVRLLLETVAEASGDRTLVQLEAATREGTLFVARDGERVVAAVTKPEPTAGLVFFDLKSCLGAAAAEAGDGKPRPKARRKREPAVSEGAE